jgi:hypothetical protein
MGTLKISFHIINGEFKPVEYELHGVDPTGHADVYYNFNNVVGNLQYVGIVKLYCYRKIDFSTMVVDGATKNFQTNRAKGTITYHQNPAQAIITPAPSSLRCIGLNGVCLLNAAEDINQASRKKLPHYMLASHITQLIENVQFDAIWSNNLKEHHRYSHTQGRWCTFMLNLFPNE